MTDQQQPIQVLSKENAPAGRAPGGPLPHCGSGASENFRKLPIPGDCLNETPSSLNDEPSLPQAAPPSLDARQHAAIELLVMGKRFGDVAQAIGVSARTLYAWRADPEFRQDLERRREELWSSAALRLRAMVHPSLDILEAHLSDPYDRARFRAASTIFRLTDLRRAINSDES